MDVLTKAIIDAGAELGRDHNWRFDDDGMAEWPLPDDVFTRVLHKHLAPLVELDGVIRARREMLLSELAALDALATQP